MKDKHAKAMLAMTRDVNTVWNYCNETQYRSLKPYGIRHAALVSAIRAGVGHRAACEQETPRPGYPRQDRQSAQGAIHKETSALVSKHVAIFVGNVNAKALAKTSMAKSVHDAAWTTFRTQLKYKAISQCVVFEEVNEAFQPRPVRVSAPCPTCGRKVSQDLE